jgi:hypothetical protein
MGFQTFVRLTIFQPMYKARKKGMLMSIKQIAVRDDGCLGHNKEQVLTACKEVRGIEVPEDKESVDEDKDDDPENSPDGEPWLQLTMVNEFRTIETLSLHAAVCT